MTALLHAIAFWRRLRARLNNWLDGISPRQAPDLDRGDPAEEADEAYTGWKPRERG